jgi:hypothetical protein
MVAPPTHSVAMFGLPHRGRATSYTLWSRDRLLGDTELDYARIDPKSCMGDFIPTEFGESLMPIITGVSSALIDLSRKSREIRREVRSPTTASEHIEMLRQTTAYADSKAVQDQCEALELVLRGPDGVVIPTESIGIQDTEFLLALAEEAVDEFESDVILPDGADSERLAEIEHEAAILDEVCDELDDPEDDFEAAVSEPWDEPTFPRYQIQIRLVDEWSIP